MTADECERRLLRFEFEHWLETHYRKLDDRGGDRGPFTVGEIERSMHRGYPADKIVLDMMRAIHRYFEFPATNRMAVGLGGGHNGFSVALLHLMNPNDAAQHVYVDTPKIETRAASTGGFFRQSWGAQVHRAAEVRRRRRSGARALRAAARGTFPPRKNCGIWAFACSSASVTRPRARPPTTKRTCAICSTGWIRTRTRITR